MGSIKLLLTEILTQKYTTKVLEISTVVKESQFMDVVVLSMIR